MEPISHGGDIASNVRVGQCPLDVAFDLLLAVGVLVGNDAEAMVLYAYRIAFVIARFNFRRVDDHRNAEPDALAYRGSAAVSDEAVSVGQDLQLRRPIQQQRVIRHRCQVSRSALAPQPEHKVPVAPLDKNFQHATEEAGVRRPEGAE